MNRAATSTIAVVLGLVLIVVGVALVVGFGTDGATAVEAGNETVSRQDVNDELRALRDNDQLMEAGGQQVARTRGSVVSQLASGYALTGIVQEALIKQYLERNGERITAADRDQGAQQFGETFVGQYSDGFPAWYLKRSKERLAAYVALSRVTGIDLSSEASVDEIATELRPVARKVGVTVDPRYGRYNPRQVAVVPYQLPDGLLDRSTSN
jgi:hypothetical protein